MATLGCGLYSFIEARLGLVALAATVVALHALWSIKNPERHPPWTGLDRHRALAASLLIFDTFPGAEILVAVSLPSRCGAAAGCERESQVRHCSSGTPARSGAHRRGDGAEQRRDLREDSSPRFPTSSAPPDGGRRPHRAARRRHRARPRHGAELRRLLDEKAHEMSSIIDDLLTVTQLEAVNIQIRVGATRLLPEVTRTARLWTPGRRGDRPPQPGRGGADGLRLRQIIRNLVSNGITYGGDRIRTAAETTDGPRVEERAPVMLEGT